MKGILKITVKDKATGKIKLIQTYKNLNPLAGKTLIANNLSSATPDDNIRVNYAGVGTGTTPPADGDTQLEAEVFRNQIASASNANNVCFFTMFIDADDSTGTYREAGIFAGASSTPDSGVILSRVSINVTKGITETLTLDWEIEIA